MPIINIHLLEGRSEEQKRNLVVAVTEAVCKHANVPPENVRIILSDMAPQNYAIAGVLVADKKPAHTPPPPEQEVE